jgi:hypothetical protein
MQYQLLLVGIVAACFLAFKACEYRPVWAFVQAVAFVVACVAAVEFIREQL